jgi:hypothetical protein
MSTPLPGKVDVIIPNIILEPKDSRSTFRHKQNFLPAHDCKPQFRVDMFYSVKRYKKKSLELSSERLPKINFANKISKLIRTFRKKANFGLLQKSNNSYVKLSHNRNLSEIGKIQSRYNSPLPRLIYKTYSRKHSPNRSEIDHIGSYGRVQFAL